MGAVRQVGGRVGEWVVDRYLASGGMGDVYVGHHAETGEPVALKFLAQDSDAALMRFQREQRIASRLSHPHIVRVHGHGTTPQGDAFLVMELLEGTDLEQRLQRDPPTPSETVAIVMQVTSALEAAHAAHIIHRDLKPQNVFLCRATDVRAKVLDFGIARLVDENRMTRTGTIVGTLAYISPEQARGERDLDERTDIWSLGVLLYQCLSGVLPFAAPTGPGTLYKILFESPADLSELRRDLPHELVELVRQCLSKRRDGRPGDAATVRRALAALDRDELAAAAPPQHGGPQAEAATVLSEAEASGTDATLISPQGSATDVEMRLTSVAYLHRIGDHGLLEELARDLEGRPVSLAGDDAMVLFGLERWTGDEPIRAVRLALALASQIDSAGLATGRALRGGEEVAGDVIDEAVGLARRGGIRLDATSAGVARARYVLEDEPDGTARVEPGAQRVSVVVDRESWPTPFVGRDAETSMLERAVEQAADALEPTAVAVFGSTGMGKSRLLAEAADVVLSARPEAAILTATCEAFRRDTPFAAVVDALSGVAEPSLLRLFDARQQTAGDHVAFLDRARTTLETVLRQLAERSEVVVVALDDAQWLDPSSRAAVRWLCDNAWDLPLALWLFSRPEGRRPLADVAPALTSVDLAPLGRSAAERLLSALAGDAPTRILERAAGHPLFLEELGQLYARGGEAAADAEALPLSIEGAHLSQLDQLDTLDREFLKRAAIFGRRAWVEGVAELGADPASVPRLRRAGLIAPRSRSRIEGARELAFRSQTMQEVAYGLWPQAQRTRLHEQAASWLAERVGAAVEELARHWEEAGQAERAADCYASAAEATVHVGDSETAIALADRALGLTDDPRVRWRAHLARDSALLPSGNRVREREGLEELESLAEGLGLAERTEAAARWCSFARVTGDRDGCLRHGGQAIGLARELGSAVWGSRVHNELVLLHADEGRFEAAAEHAAQARRLAEEAGDGWLLARVQGTEAYVLVESGQPLAALELFQRSAEGFARVGDRHRESIALANAGDALLGLGRLAEAEELIRRAIDGARRLGNARTVAVGTANLGTIHRMRGEHGAARETLERAAAEADRIDHPRLACAVAVELGYLALAEGAAPDALRSLAADALSRAERARSPGLVASARAFALRARRRAGDDVDDLVPSVQEALGTVDGQARVEVLAALGRADELTTTLSELGAGLEDEDARVLRDALGARLLLRNPPPP